MSIVKHRNHFLGLVLLALMLAACGGSDDDAATQEHYTIGLVVPHEITLSIFDTYRLEMDKLGYIEGDNITYIQQGPPDSFVDMLQVPALLVEEGVDIIVVIATEGGLLAQGATDVIPILFIAGDTPVEAGLVESLERPGGNVTGVMATGPEARRMELFLEMVPDMQRLYVPHSMDDMMADNSMREIEAAAEDFGIEIVTFPVEDESQIQSAIDSIPDDVDGIFIPQDLMVTVEMSAWADTALEKKLPLSVPGVGESEVGIYPINPLMGYGLSLQDLGNRSARLTDQILRGTSPGDLPIESAEFYLMVNVDTAEAIGVELPDHILEQANFVTFIQEEGEE